MPPSNFNIEPGASDTSPESEQSPSIIYIVCIVVSTLLLSVSPCNTRCTLIALTCNTPSNIKIVKNPTLLNSVFTICIDFMVNNTNTERKLAYFQQVAKNKLLIKFNLHKKISTQQNKKQKKTS